MIRNKKILSVIVATAIVSNMITITPYAMTREDDVYKIAYDATIKALENKSQKEINEARQAINNIPQNLLWARGEFSKQVDTVQHPILVEIVNAIQIAKKSGSQKDINEARKRIPETLPQEWRGAYSVALDDIQRDIMKKLVDAVEKAKATKNKDDIKIATELLNILKTVEGNDNVKVWSDKLSQEFQDFVKKIDSSNNSNNGGGSSSGGGGGSSISTVYNISCKADETIITDVNGAKTVNITGDANGTVRLKNITVDKININAAQGTIYLDNVTVGDLNIVDVANHSLYVTDSSINNMTVEDKDNNAHIVVGGTKTKIKNAEVRSGANIEGETTIDSLVLNNKNKLSKISLAGNFGASKVSVVSGGEIEVAAKLDTLTFDENLLEAAKVTLDSTTKINKMEVKSDGSVELKAKDNNEATIINAIKDVQCNDKNTAIKDIETKVKLDVTNKETKEKVIVDSFSKYINGNPSEDNAYKEEKDKEVLSLLEQYKNDLNLPSEFYNTWTDEKLEYASSVRCFIKGQTQAINITQLQSFLDMSKGDVRVRLESYKFKAHPQNKNFEHCTISVKKSSTNVDITDELMKVTNQLRFDTNVEILGIGERIGFAISKNNCFEVVNKNGFQRVILKSVNDSITNKFLVAGIVIKGTSTSTNTDLMVQIIVEDSKEMLLINEFNKYYGHLNVIEDDQTKKIKDEEVYKLLIENKELLNLQPDFLNRTDGEKRKVASLLRASMRWIPQIKMLAEVMWQFDNVLKQVELYKFCAYNEDPYNATNILKINGDNLKDGMDVTDEIIKLSNPLNPNAKVQIDSISCYDVNSGTLDSKAFEINQNQRIIVKDINEIDDRIINVNITLLYNDFNGTSKYGGTLALKVEKSNNNQNMYEGYLVYSDPTDPTKMVYSQGNSMDVKLNQPAGTYKLAYFFKDATGAEMPGITNATVIENLNPNIAVLNNDGAITTIAEGTAYFKVNIQGSMKTIAINVLPEPKPCSLTLDNENLTLTSGSNETYINATVRDQYGLPYKEGITSINVLNSIGNYVGLNDTLAPTLYSTITSTGAIDCNGNEKITVTPGATSGKNEFRIVFTRCDQNGQVVDSITKQFKVEVK